MIICSPAKIYPGYMCTYYTSAVEFIFFMRISTVKEVTNRLPTCEGRVYIS
jgi:predicted nucleotide-binding protein (sugar kinase/HSP70/actin superfamily)